MIGNKEGDTKYASKEAFRACRYCRRNVVFCSFLCDRKDGLDHDNECHVRCIGCREIMRCSSGRPPLACCICNENTYCDFSCKLKFEQKHREWHCWKTCILKDSFKEMEVGAHLGFFTYLFSLVPVFSLPQEVDNGEWKIQQVDFKETRLMICTHQTKGQVTVGVKDGRWRVQKDARNDLATEMYGPLLKHLVPFADQWVREANRKVNKVKSPAEQRAESLRVYKLALSKGWENVEACILKKYPEFEKEGRG
jgi:hypothetical protein